MVVLLYGFPDVVFFIPGLLCNNVFCFWSSYGTHGYKLGVAAGGILVGKSFWHLRRLFLLLRIRIRWRDFIKLKNFWLVCGCAISLGNYGVQGSILKRIGGAGAGISFAWLPRLVLCDHTGNVIVT